MKKVSLIPDEKTGMRRHAKRLLIIDDDREDCKLFIEAVKEIDDAIECISAANGKEALALLNGTHRLPDFIILDLRMPGYDGKRCLLELKADDRFKNIPVFIYTTSRNVDESNELLAMGACHFMTKPSDADEIYYLASFILGEQWERYAKRC